MENVGTVYLLCGLPGSGKTTWAKMKRDASPDSTIVINRDALRSMVTGGKYVFNGVIEPVIRGMTENILGGILYDSMEFDIVVDETNITKKKRAEWMDVVPAHVDVVCVWFTEAERNLDHRMTEPRGYPREKWAGVIASMKEAFETPAKEEGFIEIEKVDVVHGIESRKA